MPAQIDKEKCEGCGDCVEACPSSAIVIVENSAKKAEVKKDECIDCGACVDACPTQAIAMID
jgi:ferredoxin